MEKRLEATKGVTALHGPYDQKQPSAISGDGHSVLVSFEIPGDPKDEAVADAVDETLAQTAAAQKSHPGSTSSSSARVARRSSSWRSSTRTSAKATFGSLPITLILLVIAFGTLSWPRVSRCCWP